MKNKPTNFSRLCLRLSLATLTALTIGLLSVAAKPSHGGGSGGGGSTGSFPYPTASTVSQLSADLTYANQVGGTYTIYLQPNITFTNVLLGVGGPKPVNVTIIGNGDTFIGPGVGEYLSRFFVVSAGASLTLEQLTLRNGCVYANFGGAIYNSGTLTLSNCTLSGNTSIDRSDYLTALRGVGGAIYNNGGTVLIANSILSDNLSTGANPMGGAIYNAAPSGTVTISNSIFIGNVAYGPGGYTDPEYPISGEGGSIFNESGTVTISHSSLTSNSAVFMGGGVCNGGVYYSGGTIIVKDSSYISGNTIDDVQNFGTLYLDNTQNIIGTLDGNPAHSL